MTTSNDERHPDDRLPDLPLPPNDPPFECCPAHEPRPAYLSPRGGPRPPGPCFLELLGRDPTLRGWRQLALAFLPLEKVYRTIGPHDSAGPGWRTLGGPRDVEADRVADGAPGLERGVLERKKDGWRRSPLQQIALERGCDDVEAAAAELARLSGVRLPAAVERAWHHHLWAHAAWLHVERRLLRDAAIRPQVAEAVVVEALSDVELLVALGFVGRTQPGRFQAILAELRRGGAGHQAVRTLAKAARAEAERELAFLDAPPPRAKALGEPAGALPVDADGALARLGAAALVAWAKAHPERIYRADAPAAAPIGGWAARWDGRVIAFERQALGEILAAAGLDPKAVLRAWKAAGVVVIDGADRRGRRRVRVGDGWRWMVGLRREALAEKPLPQLPAPPSTEARDATTEPDDEGEGGA
jgi:hypothetical protein